LTPTRHFQCRTFGLSVTSPGRRANGWPGRLDREIILGPPATVRKGAWAARRPRNRSIREAFPTAGAWERRQPLSLTEITVQGTLHPDGTIDRIHREMDEEKRKGEQR
jgi:hypothetical protein